MPRSGRTTLRPLSPEEEEGAVSPPPVLRHALLRPGAFARDALLRLSRFRDQRRPRSTAATLPHEIGEGAWLEAAAHCYGTTVVDPVALGASAALIDRLGLGLCLRHAIAPLRQAGAVTLLATARPEEFQRLRPEIEARIGPVAMLLAPLAAVDTALRQARGAHMAKRAETRVPAAESCRHMGHPLQKLWWVAALLAFATLAFLSLRGLLITLSLIATFCMTVSTVLKLGATFQALRAPPEEPPPTVMARPPRVSILVALYRESSIAARLVRRLSRLDYPRELLEICLIVEEEDQLTRQALAEADLPGWFRVIIVPRGRVKTKPRALNHALASCRGSIVGIYDAEDAPEPDQIRKVVERFHRRGPKLACLQGALDYYNPRTNWIARCFTLEYASWFRLILPGLARAGLVVPLGGTTLFFRRAVLEELGAWDAHNVTEDADLGLRLVRHGYRTEILPSTTHEEANCRLYPWVRQRSRWIKGYMVTWAVHMRRPGVLLRQLGAKAFWGVQAQMLVPSLQVLLAPVLWSYWLLALGLPHPLSDTASGWILPLILTASILSAASDISLAVLGLRQSGQRLSPFWALAQFAYFPLATLAGYKALWEVCTRPFYWDKTSHGHFDQIAGSTAEESGGELGEGRARLSAASAPPPPREAASRRPC